MSIYCVHVLEMLVGITDSVVLDIKQISYVPFSLAICNVIVMNNPGKQPAPAPRSCRLEWTAIGLAHPQSHGDAAP